MATLIGDVFADSARFHSMIAGPPAQHPHEPHYKNRSVSLSRDREAPPHPTRAPSPGAQESASPVHRRGSRRAEEEAASESATGAGEAALQKRDAIVATGGGASRFPSPPPSSSPSAASSGSSRPQHAIPAYMVPTSDQPTPESAPASISSASSNSTAVTVVAAPPRSMPSPDSDTGSRRGDAAATTTEPAAGLLESPSSPLQNQTTIRVRDLAHIHSLAKADLLTATGPGILNDPPLQQMKYEISGMPIGDIIEMVAALLTKITTTNDLQHDALNRNANHVKQAQAQARSEEAGTEGSMSPLSSSVLAFHGKNVPAITILSYLSRIHKYCPTTYEVFLSLLVYFDRMTERVNDMVMKSEKTRQLQSLAQAQEVQSTTAAASDNDTTMRDDDETDSDLADDDDKGEGRTAAATGGSVPNADAPASQATYFVVDSFNIHRLIIAGVTCASKFFSDVFYTNSRYAKVGGLPLPELNHLELQFLLLNDFRLAVPVEDLEAYATMLVEFYAREVVAQRSRPVTGTE
ncbi:cyclin-domain-containing protein [Podospora aff. communis PSN243]|uniref:Cyclin-domain-containing protein n=1 Tax=Podospora aff. communis PSN243 TaxID=3040156 RepID=A0AAV9GD56_9PEZI|nr:cyclin-domain-containing protein [Podospora aff. communis PSN243]